MDVIFTSKLRALFNFQKNPTKWSFKHAQLHGDRFTIKTVAIEIDNGIQFTKVSVVRTSYNGEQLTLACIKEGQIIDNKIYLYLLIDFEKRFGGQNHLEIECILLRIVSEENTGHGGRLEGWGWGRREVGTEVQLAYLHPVDKRYIRD